jgi:hypothetical protein
MEDEMQESDARRGVRVRCTNGTFKRDPDLPFGPEDISLPKKGQVYTIREVVQTAVSRPALRFLEVQNPCFRHTIGGLEEPAFSLSRFELAEQD